MATPLLSVIIPTHKRAGILQNCLEHIEKQTIAKQLELIVVSDGHDGPTLDLLEHIAKTEHSPNASLASYKFFEIPKSQQGLARNRGVQEATAPIILFAQDDIFLAPDACEMHLQAHGYEKKKLRVTSDHLSNPLETQNSKLIAVLGFTTWDPTLTITPVMKWLEQTGWQFGYPMIEHYAHGFVPSDIQHRFTYTSHISVPTAVARAHPFRTDVTLYGWEDILWGQELKKDGIPLRYEPDAKALHHHHITLEQSLARMETIGQSLVHITKIAPDLDRRPTGLKLIAYRLISLLPTMRGRHYHAFLRGLATR